MKKNNIKFAFVAVIAFILTAACYNPFLQLSGEREIESGTGHTDSMGPETIQDGTKDFPFLVHDELELGYVGKGAANPIGYKNWSMDVCYRQVDNIDMAEVDNFKPIGGMLNQFRGSYDGGGHVIKDLVIGDADTGYVGLFGYISNQNGFGIVENLGLVNADITGAMYAGAIAGYSEKGTLRNCFATGISINCPTLLFPGVLCIGGIAGVNYGGIVEYCFAAFEEINGNTLYCNVGGIVGKNTGVSPGTVQNCIAFSKGMISESNGGRITSPTVGVHTLYRNYAWEGTELELEALPIEDGCNEKDGESLSVAQIKTQDLWIDPDNWWILGREEAWDFGDVWGFGNIWEWDDTGEYMPRLKNSPAIPWPDYLE